MLPRAVVDRQLGDAEAPVVREDRDEAVELAVKGEALHDLGAIRLQPAVHVVQPQAGDPARDRVEDPRHDPPAERIAALGLPAGDEVEALVQLREQARNLARVVLEVAVDRDDRLAVCVREPGCECGGGRGRGGGGGGGAGRGGGRGGGGGGGGGG